MRDIDKSRLRSAVKIFLYSEKVKSSLILVSKILRSAFERYESRYFKMLFEDMINALIGEVSIAYNATENVAFKEANLLLNEAIKYIGKEDYTEAFNRLSKSISIVTSAAVEGVAVLEEEGLI